MKMIRRAFPSPYGVSFILIRDNIEIVRTLLRNKFPSPYGVSFILIRLKIVKTS